MSDFDCTDPACMTPAVCLEQDRCCALSVPEINDQARRERVRQLIAETRNRLREVKQ